MNNPLANLLPEFLKLNNLGAQLVLILGILMFFGTIGGHLFQKIKVPQVVGFFVIGIIIGDSGLQLVSPEAVALLNPISVIALSFIGFLVGGELKLEVIKKSGAQFVSVLLFESLVPAVIVSVFSTIAVYFFTKDFILSLCFGILLGAICSSTAPEATTNVLQEYRSRGPVTTMIYGIVAMDDAVALILFAVTSTIAAPLLGGHATSFGMQMLNIAKTVFGSIALGVFLGFLLKLILKNLMNQEGKALSYCLGILLISTGICETLGLNDILCSMSIGFFMANWASKNVKQIFGIANKFTPPIYVLFFVVVGAKLNIWAMKPMLIILAAVYIIGRTLGKSVGSWFGAWITKAPKTIQKNMRYCLLSQAGVAIGLSLTAGNYFKDTIGDQILLIVTATTFVAELIGPIFVKKGITKAGEVGLNITEDDIKKKTKLNEVTWGSVPVCSIDSPSIVSETDTVDNIIESFSSHHNQTFVVKNEKGELTGIITMEHLKETLMFFDFAESMLAMDIMDKPEHVCSPDISLPDLYEQFSESDTEALPIVDKDGKVLGVAERFAVDHYIHQKIIELHRKLEKLSAGANA